mgnify:CR=1 FL=1
MSQDLEVRKDWETRQTTWYKMRHNGLRRKRLPWPDAADLHYPLCDTTIGKLKPYYFEQLYAEENLAVFASEDRTRTEDQNQACASWFDYQLKECSNLEIETLSLIDHMLMSGRPVLKVSWDEGCKQVRFDALHPLRTIVPRGSIDCQSLYRLTHVMVMSEEEYKSKPAYNQDPVFIQTIKGRGLESSENGQKQDINRREGITCGSTTDEIVVWETYVKDPKTEKWTVYTTSPLNHLEAVRPPMELPYRHGKLPFVDFPYEVKDKGWYSPRGVVEQLAPYEASLCKLWNEKHDAMTLFNRPLFSSSQPIPNQSNLQLHPGSILPFDIRPIQQGNPPISWDQELIQTRQAAEQRIAVPDYGMNQVMSTRDRRTATEIESINQVSGSASDLRMRIFRHRLSQVYQMAWDLLLEFKSDSLTYFSAGRMVQIDKKLLTGGYRIRPRGSADGVNKSFNVRKAVNRFQMFANDPYINQVELRRSVLNADDASLTKILLVEPGIAEATQMEDQAQEISVLMLGFPAVVQPMDDDMVHIKTCVQFLQSRQEPVTGPGRDRIHEHIQAHLVQLAQKDPKMARQVEAALQAVDQQPAQQPTA